MALLLQCCLKLDIHSLFLLCFSDDLVVKESGSYLSAKQVWGALRALETLSQLVVKSPAGEVSCFLNSCMKRHYIGCYGDIDMF